MRRDVVKIITETEEQIIRLVSAEHRSSSRQNSRLQRLSATQKARAERLQSKAAEKTSAQYQQAWAQLIPPSRLSQLETELKTKHLLVSLSNIALEDLKSDTSQSPADKQTAIEIHEQRKRKAESDVVSLEVKLGEHDKALAYLSQPERTADNEAWSALQDDAHGALTVCS